MSAPLVRKRWLPLLWLLPLAGGLVWLSHHNYLLYHSLVELFSLVIAFGAFALAWHTRRLTENGYLLFVGIALLFVAAVDGVHTLAYQGMGIFPEDDANLPTQLWVAGRYLQAAALLLGLRYLRRLPDPTTVLGGFAALTVVLLGAIFGGLFPACFVTGEGLTPFKLGSEYAVVAVVGLALLRLRAARAELPTEIVGYLQASMALTMAQELAFTLYTDVYGLSNMVGHLFKAGAYYCIYRGIVVAGLTTPYDLLFYRLKQGRDQLAATNRELERAKAASEGRLALLLDTMAEGVYAVDREGRCVVANPACARLLGYPGPEALLGREMHPLIHGHHPDGQPLPVTECPIHLAVVRGEKSAGEEWFRRADGRFLPVEYHAVPVKTEQEGVTGAVVSFWDISERKEAEAQLHRAKEAAEAGSRAKSQFLAVMSHEIRTPMNAVVGMAELLAETELDGEQQSYLETQRRAANTLLALIDDILDLTRVESGKVRLHPETFALAELFDELTHWVRPLIEKKALAFRVEIDPALPPRLYGDVSRLRQILFNLAANAAKFTPAGRITVTAQAAGAGCIRFAVNDTGIGIPAERQQEIFEPFTQVDSTLTRKYGGTGLGLSISRQLTEALGGDITLASDPDRGSTFTFTIPLDADRQPAAPPSPPPAEPGGGRALKILLAEDSADNAALVRAYLKKSPHQLAVAENGREAVEMFKAARYDLVLMDIQMPLLDGYGATREIRAHEQARGTPPIPVIALTAHAMDGDADKSLAAGCDAHLTKPIKKSVLLQALQHHALPQ
ncbi:MASE3 domain-containing protein [Endothiovibrio diazotrophicus]